MAAELGPVFLNLDEFACIHEINGEKIKCVVDDTLAEAATRSADGFANVSGIGLLACDRLVYCEAADLCPQPLPGEKLAMDGDFWLVADSGVTECEGLLTLPLRRAF